MIGSVPSCFCVLVVAGYSSWILPRWYMVSIAPSTPPRSEIALELLVDGLLDEVGELLDDERALPGVLVLLSPSSRLMISWIATARRTLSSVGVVIASS